MVENWIKNKKDKIINQNIFSFILAFYCITRLSFVCTTTISYFNLILVFLVGLAFIFICSLSSQKYRYDFMNVNIVFLVIYIGLVFFIRSCIKDESYLVWPDKYIKQLLVLLIIWGLYVYLKNCNAKERKILLLWYLLGITASAAYTFYVALTSSNDDVIRQTAYGIFDTSFRFTYGGFDFIYGLVIVYVCLLTPTHRSWKNLTAYYRICFVAIMTISALTIIISGYSTAFALIFIFSFLELLPKGYFKYLLLCFFALIVFVFPQIITGIINSIPFIPDLTAGRINSAFLSLSGRETVGYLSEDGQRMDRILWSLRIFAEHPLLGGFFSNTKLPFGYHTEWIEQLARYGLISAVPFWIFIINTKKTMLRNKKRQSACHKTLQNAFVVFFILGFLDPISMVITIAPIFILAPFISETFNKVADSMNGGNKNERL